MFTSAAWTLAFPNTTVQPLTRNISGHVPSVVKIDTKIPKSPVFRFENFWVDMDGFYDIVQMVWSFDPGFEDPAKCISFNMKLLRKKLLLWSKNLSRLMLLLMNCNRVIDFLDLVQEARNLTTFEWIFREIVKVQILKLLEFRKIYWKKRCTNRWMLLGEENTKFFQSIATERYIINTVSQVRDNNGQVVFSHEQKASLFLQSFKNRMGGVTNYLEIAFDLGSLFSQSLNLDSLVDMFSTQEISSHVSIVPADKAPGPDGFNGYFLNKCWHIITQDYYELAAHFYASCTDLQIRNSSYITLVPKKSSPKTVNDFRPISLMGLSLKFLTKLMADRLQGVILKLVSDN